MTNLKKPHELEWQEIKQKVDNISFEDFSNYCFENLEMATERRVFHEFKKQTHNVKNYKLIRHDKGGFCVEYFWTSCEKKDCGLKPKRYIIAWNNHDKVAYERIFED